MKKTLSMIRRGCSCHFLVSVRLSGRSLQSTKQASSFLPICLWAHSGMLSAAACCPLPAIKLVSSVTAQCDASPQTASILCNLPEADVLFLQRPGSSRHARVPGGWRGIPPSSLLLISSLSCRLQGSAGRAEVDHPDIFAISSNGRKSSQNSYSLVSSCLLIFS